MYAFPQSVWMVRTAGRRVLTALDRPVNQMGRLLDDLLDINITKSKLFLKRESLE